MITICNHSYYHKLFALSIYFLHSLASVSVNFVTRTGLHFDWDYISISHIYNAKNMKMSKQDKLTARTTVVKSIKLSF